MIVIIEGNNGYTIANNGQVLAVTNTHGHHVPVCFTAVEITELRTALGVIPRPVGSTAVSPAKARFKSPIMCYPAKAEQ